MTTYNNTKSAKRAAERDTDRLSAATAFDHFEIEAVKVDGDDRFQVVVYLDMVEGELSEADQVHVANHTVVFMRKAKKAAKPATAEKTAGRRKGSISCPADERAYPARANSKQAQIIDFLFAGATIDDLRRVCIKKDGQPWDDASIRSACYWDMRQKGYGVRTEWKCGYELWVACSFDTAQDFLDAIQGCPLIEEVGSQHPDDFTTEQHLVLRDYAIANGYSDEYTYPVYFLVLPEGLDAPVPHKTKGE